MPSCTIFSVNSDSVLAIFWNLSGDSLIPLSFSSGIGGRFVFPRARGVRLQHLLVAPAPYVVAGGAVMAYLILRFTRTLGTARLPSWAETCEVNTAKLVCNLAARKPWPHPKGTGAAESGKHPVEIGHDEIEVRFAPICGGWVSIRTFIRESIFQHILEIPAPAVCLLGKILLDRRRRPRDIW